MQIRPLLFWLHLGAGVLAGVVILIMSVTGVLLTYEKQMVAWAERLSDSAVPHAHSERLSIEALLARARTAKPDATPSGVTVRADRREPVLVAFGRDQILLNPYTGEVLTGATGLREFFHVVTDWHRWLGAHGDLRPTGRAITGASNLIFLFIVLSGAYLWLPRAWTWVQVRAVVWFRGGLRGKARDFNWHNVVGLWSFVPLALIVASGAVISYPWASDLVYRVMGETPPTAQARPAAAGGERRGGARERPVEVHLAGLDAHLARAASQVEGWRSIALRVPSTPTAPLVFTIDAGTGGQPQKRGTLTLDRTTGNVVSWEPFASATPGRRARMILRFAHTGEVLGLAGQTIAGLVSAGGALLVYTGLALSLRRFLAWRRRRVGTARLAA